MLLKELLKDIEVLESNFFLDENLEINKIAFHTDKVEKGDVFVAIKGYITDGHKYIGKAVERGAVLCIVEDMTDIDIRQIKVENSRITLADLSYNYFNPKNEKMYTVGITATNGKTTTSFMVDSIFKRAGLKTGIIGTVEVKYDDVVIPSLLTTPESLELQEHIYNMRKANCDIMTMEVSSSAQELYRNRNIDFDIVTFNNLSREHLDQHGGFENYYWVKSKIIREASGNTVAILNFDYELIKDLADNTKARVLSYSLENSDNDFYITDLDLTTGKGKYTFNISKDIQLPKTTIKKGSFPIDLNVAGYSSVMNSFVAVIIALTVGIDIDVIQEGLNIFTGVERRFEMIYDEDYMIVDDHFANTKNIEVTLGTLEQMDYNDFHFLYAIRGNRGVNLNKENAEEIVKWVKKLQPKYFYATLSTDTVDSKDTVSKEELDIFLQVMSENNIEVKIIDKLEDSINEMMENIGNNDVLLLAGCQGMDKGAKYALGNIIKLDKSSDPKRLQALIDNRIC